MWWSCVLPGRAELTLSQMYHLRGLDILEGYQAKGQQDPETIAKDLLYMSEMLDDIYRKTNSTEDAKRHKERVKAWLENVGIEGKIE